MTETLKNKIIRITYVSKFGRIQKYFSILSRVFHKSHDLNCIDDHEGQQVLLGEHQGEGDQCESQTS